jgi:predicted phage tail protein
MMLTNIFSKISDLETEIKTISEAINALDLNVDAMRRLIPSSMYCIGYFYAI